MVEYVMGGRQLMVKQVMGGWQLMVKQVPIHEPEDGEALLSMLGLRASLVMLGR